MERRVSLSTKKRPRQIFDRVHRLYAIYKKSKISVSKIFSECEIFDAKFFHDAEFVSTASYTKIYLLCKFRVNRFVSLKFIKNLQAERRKDKFWSIFEAS